jgi:hypothetical protein
MLVELWTACGLNPNFRTNAVLIGPCLLQSELKVIGLFALKHGSPIILHRFHILISDKANPLQLFERSTGVAS